MTTLIIPLDKPPQEIEPVTHLVAALADAELLTVRPANLITTDDPHVAALLERYAQLVPEHSPSTVLTSPDMLIARASALPPVLLEHPHQPAPIPPVRVKKAVPVSENGNTEDAEAEEITYTNVATGEVHTAGAIRQMLRFGRIESGQEFYHSKKGLMVARVGPGYKMKLYVVPKPELS